MATKQQPQHHLRIPVGSGDTASEARKLSRHLLTIQRLAMNSIRPNDDFDSDELEAFQAVFALLIGLHQMEDEAASPQSSPP